MSDILVFIAFLCINIGIIYVISDAIAEWKLFHTEWEIKKYYKNSDDPYVFEISYIDLKRKVASKDYE